MYKYFVNYSVGFLVVAVFCAAASARGLSLLEVLVKDPRMADPHKIVETNVDPANSLDIDEQPKSTVPASHGKKYITRKFVSAKLEVPENGVTIVEGHSYELTCVVDGRPGMTIHWIRDENLKEKIDELKAESVPSGISELDEANLIRIRSKYVIDCATKKDQGPIHCVAISGDLSSHNSTTIIVDDSLRRTHMCSQDRAPVIKEFASTLLANSGTSVVLPCRAVGVPTPMTRWFDLQGTEIVNHLYNPRYKVLATGDLFIENLEWDDMNGLICTAESIMGVDRAETFLYPMRVE